MLCRLSVVVFVVMASLASGVHAQVPDDLPPVTDPGMRKRACRLLRYGEAVDKSLDEWWRASGVSRWTLRRKAKLDRKFANYFCEATWPDGKPSSSSVAYYMREISRVDTLIIQQVAQAGDVRLTNANRDEVASSINQMAAHFLHMRMRGCGSLSDDGPLKIGNFLSGGGKHGIDIFGNELSSVPAGQVLPVAGQGSAFFDSRSICSGNNSGGGGGGGGHAPQAGSASGALTCYMDTMQSQSHCQDRPAPALNPHTALLVPGWLAGEGAEPVEATEAAAEPTERGTATREEFIQDTILLATATGYWIAQVGVASGVAFTTLASIGLTATPVGIVVGTISLGVGAWKYYGKYYGENRVDVGPRMCPMFTTSSGPFHMASGLFPGANFGSVDVFAACADVECTGALGIKTMCQETQLRHDCQTNPQVFDQEKCVPLMMTNHEDEWNEAGLAARFCSMATCSDGQSASYGAGGCACSGSKKSSVGDPRLVYNPCWYSYCEEQFRVFRKALVRRDALRYVRELRRITGN